MYELLYTVPAIYAEDELKKVTDKIEKILTDAGVEVAETKNAGKLKFAYPIKKYTVGYYVLVYMNATGEVMQKLNRLLQLDKDVLRFMVTKQKSKGDVKLTEYVAPDPSERKKEYRGPAKEKERDKDKIRLEDIDKKLDTLLEKDIV